MNSSALTPQSNHSRETIGEAYLSFRLDEKTPAVFSMEQAQEFIALSLDQITPVPNMPACVLGLLSRRSRVMWVVDLAQMLTSRPFISNLDQYKVIIIRVTQAPRQQNMPLTPSRSHVFLGLIVQEVEGVIRLTPNLIQVPPRHFSSSLIPYLKGCLLRQDNMLLVLDAEAIAQSLMLQSN